MGGLGGHLLADHRRQLRLYAVEAGRVGALGVGQLEGRRHAAAPGRRQPQAARARARAARQREHRDRGAVLGEERQEPVLRGIVGERQRYPARIAQRQRAAPQERAVGDRRAGVAGEVEVGIAVQRDRQRRVERELEPQRAGLRGHHRGHVGVVLVLGARHRRDRLDDVAAQLEVLAGQLGQPHHRRPRHEAVVAPAAGWCAGVARLQREDRPLVPEGAAQHERVDAAQPERDVGDAEVAVVDVAGEDDLLAHRQPRAQAADPLDLDVGADGGCGAARGAEEVDRGDPAGRGGAGERDRRVVLDAVDGGVVQRARAGRAPGGRAAQAGDVRERAGVAVVVAGVAVPAAALEHHRRWIVGAPGARERARHERGGRERDTRGGHQAALLHGSYRSPMA